MAEFAKKHRGSKWKLHVDLDEKWFYVYTHSGKLKLPPGIDKPRTALQSKRFIGKIMVLIGIARPDPRFNFDGKICCIRTTKMHAYARRTEYPRGSGIFYEAGDLRRVDDTMDGDKFAQTLIEEVFPIIRKKLKNAKEVKVQWDNAGGHGIKTLQGKIAAQLPAPHRGGKQVGPKITVVTQAAQSPDTNALDLDFNKSLDSRLPKNRDYNLDLFESSRSKS